MRLRLAPLALVLATLVASGCSGADRLLDESSLDARYAAAIADAAVVEPGEVAPLPAITDDSMTVVSWIPDQ